MKQRVSAVYTITCQPTGEQYIGSSLNVQSRWVGHRSTLKAGNHPAKLLQQRYNAYGPDAFSYAVVEEVIGIPQLRGRENYWIGLLCPALNTIGTPRETELWQLRRLPRARSINHAPCGVHIPCLCSLRQAHQWTQRDLARKADVTEPTVLRAENGGRVSFTTVRKLAVALDVAPEQLWQA